MQKSDNSWKSISFTYRVHKKDTQNSAKIYCARYMIYGNIKHIRVQNKKSRRITIMEKLLILNPGSTSTKIAYYEDEKHIFVESISHCS